MKPDKPGEWHSRDGRKIVVYEALPKCGGFNFRDLIDSGYRFPLGELEGDDWLPAVAPTFPALPPKPPQVLLHAHGQVRWYMVEGNRMRWMQGFDFLSHLPDDLKIIPHDDNDPEAVRMIEEAKRA